MGDGQAAHTLPAQVDRHREQIGALWNRVYRCAHKGGQRHVGALLAIAPGAIAERRVAGRQHIAMRHDADYAPVRADYRNMPDVMRSHQSRRIPQGVIRPQGVGLASHDVFHAEHKIVLLMVLVRVLAPIVVLVSVPPPWKPRIVVLRGFGPRYRPCSGAALGTKVIKARQR